ncbi:hypothetical protein D3C75_1049640 [compost metagenome]
MRCRMLFDGFDQHATNALPLKPRMHGDIHLAHMPVALHAARAAKADISAKLPFLQGDQLGTWRRMQQIILTGTPHQRTRRRILRPDHVVEHDQLTGILDFGGPDRERASINLLHSSSTPCLTFKISPGSQFRQFIPVPSIIPYFVPVYGLNG